MSKTNHGNTHNLLFQDYKFPLEDRHFLDGIAFMHYDGVGRGKHLAEQIRETLRVLTAYPGFRAQYAVHVTDATIPAQKEGEKPFAWRSVNEQIVLLGQKALPFTAISISNGPRTTPDVDFDLSPITMASKFEEELKKKFGVFDEWWLDGVTANKANTFQAATLSYEVRRILVDLSAKFHGRIHHDKHGKLCLSLTQRGDLQFPDERINVRIALVHPSVFNAAVIEAQEKEKAAA